MFYKFRRYDFAYQLLNRNCARSRSDRDVLNLPSINNCLQINEYNFSRMEFPCLINCIQSFVVVVKKNFVLVRLIISLIL